MSFWETQSCEKIQLKTKGLIKWPWTQWAVPDDLYAILQPLNTHWPVHGLAGLPLIKGVKGIKRLQLEFRIMLTPLISFNAEWCICVLQSLTRHIFASGIDPSGDQKHNGWTWYQAVVCLCNIHLLLNSSIRWSNCIKENQHRRPEWSNPCIDKSSASLRLHKKDKDKLFTWMRL